MQRIKFHVSTEKIWFDYQVELEFQCTKLDLILLITHHSDPTTDAIFKVQRVLSYPTPLKQHNHHIKLPNILIVIL